MNLITKFLLAGAIGCAALGASASSLYVTDADRAAVLSNAQTQPWGREGLSQIKARVDSLVARHDADPMWIVSRMAMYWKDGEHYTQCYLKKQNWDRGEGNAPVPTVRMPGMRTWNKYSNVPLADRLPYNETGDMLGIDRTNPDAAPVLVPYKESGHMVRSNNVEILSLAEDAAFLYWLEGDERYARFASDIFYAWLMGTYYMNPILDPDRSTGGPGGYEPGGICGYYDYEQIHDDLALHAAAIYNFMPDYLREHPSQALADAGLSLNDAAATVFKRFIDLGMVRGGREGNWNVNGWAMMIRPILVLESNEHYADGKGREHYLNYMLNESTEYHQAIPDIVKAYDPVTGLWPESPGYAFGVVGSLLDFAAILRPAGIDIIESTPVLQKAATAVVPWMDSRGCLPVFGDCRGGYADFNTIEKLYSYYAAVGDKDNARKMADIINNGIEKGAYRRNADSWVKLCTYAPLEAADVEAATRDRISYSPFHRVAIIKSPAGEADLQAVLYGGRHGSHLTPNGLALQMYGGGYALAPDAAGYESYWSADHRYHQSAAGANTILPGYTEGEVEVTAMDPALSTDAFASADALCPWITAVEMKAAEKRRTAVAVTAGPGVGYYVDIFRSQQPENDYIMHNVGKNLGIFNAKNGRELKYAALDSVPEPRYHEGYKWFTNVRRAEDAKAPIKAVWRIGEEGIEAMAMHLPYSPSRTLYAMDAPYTSLSADVVPGGVSSAPGTTPTLLIRQHSAQPVMAVFEPVMADGMMVENVSQIMAGDNAAALSVECVGGIKDLIVSTTDNNAVKAMGLNCNGTINVIRTKDGAPTLLYMLNGTELKFGGIAIHADTPVSIALYKEGDKWRYSSSADATCRIKGKEYHLTKTINGQL